MSSRTRLGVAAAVWTAIGAGLCIAGMRWLLGAGSTAWLAAVPPAIAAGWLKGRFVLAPRVESNSTRIVEAGEARCVGGVFSWGSWALAAGMVTAGAVLRHTPIPRPWLGVLYTAIGTGLLSASVSGWASFRAAARVLGTGPD